MYPNQDKLAGAEVFKLGPGDIDHLFRRVGAAGNPLSPFRYDAKQAAVGSPSPWFKTLAESPLCREIGRLLLEPGVKIAFYTGGNNTAEDQFCVLLTRENSPVLAQLTGSEGHILLLYFPSGASFTTWWTDIYAAAGMEGYPGIFEGAGETEVLICALHCVDLYRRFYLESMLDYRGLVDLSVTTADFVQLLKKSLASKDKRWLLPAMFDLTPGLRGSNIALKPEHFAQLEKAGFVTSKDSHLTLAERSRLMGTEFVTSWMSAAGLQAIALLKGKEKVLSRLFLATTAFTNHLFSFETGPGGENRFRHQSGAGPELAGTLANWIESCRKDVGGGASNAGVVAGGAPGAKFCSRCGSKIQPGKKFCTNCGSAVQ